MHGFCHPVARHLKKLFPKLLISRKSGKPHALASVAHAFLISGAIGHLLEVPCGDAKKFRATPDSFPAKNDNSANNTYLKESPAARRRAGAEGF